MLSFVPFIKNRKSVGTNPSESSHLDMRALFENSPIASYTTDHKGYLTSFNQAAVTLWGRTPQLGKDLWCGSWKIFYPDGRPMPLDECPMALTLKKEKAHENSKITIERPDGSFRNLLVFPRPILDEKGKLKGAHNTLVDITEQQKAEIKQETLSAIVESSRDAIVSKDLNGIITSWNKGAESIFKYSEEEVIGKSITLLIPDERLNEENYILEKVRNGEKIEPFETYRRDKDGREFPVSLSISPVKDSEGNVVGASKIARDITAQVQAQKDIQKYTRNLEILNSVGKSISKTMDVQNVLQKVTDATTALTGAAFGAFFYNEKNEAGESMLLYTLSGAPREAFDHFGTPRHTAVFHPTFAGQGVVRVADITKDPRYGKNRPFHGMPKGHLPVVSYMGVPVVSTSGEVIGGLIFGHPESGKFKKEHEDLVTNIAAQAAISIDNSKLFERVKNLSAKKDEFIALASHELRTPLTTIKGYLQVLSQQEKDEALKNYLNKTLDQANKLNNLVEELLNMSRIEGGKLEFNSEVFEIREMLQEVCDSFCYTNTSHRVELNLGDTPVNIDGDRQRLEQVVVNLLSNAVKYSPGKEKVYLSLELEKEQVKITVKDEGIGLTKEQQGKIFSRFYRAENTNGISGLGLGLYLTKQILDRHNAKLYVSSEFGKGSEFTFYLPLNL